METHPKSDNTYYVDAESNIQFMIPAGWNEESLSDQSEATQAQLKAKFVNNRDGIAVIIYMSYDIASMAGNNEDEIAWARKEFSTEMLSEELIESMAGAAGTVPEDIQLKQYGENTYYVYDAESALDSKTRVAIMVKNGYGIMFMLNAFSLDAYTTEFDSILASVAFQ